MANEKTYEIFLSELLNRSVLGLEGEKIGKLNDFVVKVENTFPKIISLILRSKGKSYLIPWKDIQFLSRQVIVSNTLKDDILSYDPKEAEILICKDLLDKQIMDINGIKVVRINDIRLGKIKSDLCLIAVDVGIRGIFRRLGIKRWAGEFFWKIISRRLPYDLISWEYLEPIEPRLTSLTLTVPRTSISKLHPSDIAHILSQISARDQAIILDSLEKEKAAETIHEFDPQLQKSIMENIDKDRASDLLELMPPDEAADLLGDLSEEKAKELLEGMEEEEAREVKDLLEYPEDSAGGLMTTEFLSFPPHLRIREVIEKIREEAPEVETIYYIYVTDDDEHLLGVFSLKEIIMSDPEAEIQGIMTTQVKSLHPDASEKDAGKILSKYNLLAIPIVDKEKRILGIVTVDDILKLLIPSQAKGRRQ